MKVKKKIKKKFINLEIYFDRFIKLIGIVFMIFAVRSYFNPPENLIWMVYIFLSFMFYVIYPLIFRRS